MIFQNSKLDAAGAYVSITEGFGKPSTVRTEIRIEASAEVVATRYDCGFLYKNKYGLYLNRLGDNAARSLGVIPLTEHVNKLLSENIKAVRAGRDKAKKETAVVGDSE